MRPGGVTDPTPGRVWALGSRRPCLRITPSAGWASGWALCRRSLQHTPRLISAKRTRRPHTRPPAGKHSRSNTSTYWSRRVRSKPILRAAGLRRAAGGKVPPRSRPPGNYGNGGEPAPRRKGGAFESKRGAHLRSEPLRPLPYWVGSQHPFSRPYSPTLGSPASFPLNRRPLSAHKAGRFPHLPPGQVFAVRPSGQRSVHPLIKGSPRRKEKPVGTSVDLRGTGEPLQLSVDSACMQLGCTHFQGVPTQICVPGLGTHVCVRWSLDTAVGTLTSSLPSSLGRER